MDKIKWLNVYLNLWRVLPAYYMATHNKMREKCKKDMDVWINNLNQPEKNRVTCFGYILLYQKQFRNLLLNRLHRNSLKWVFVRVFFHPMDSLYINMPPEKIGGGGYTYNMDFQQ